MDWAPMESPDHAGDTMKAYSAGWGLRSLLGPAIWLEMPIVAARDPNSKIPSLESIQSWMEAMRASVEPADDA